MKATLRVVVIGKISDEQVYTGEDDKDATMSDPLRIEITRFYVNFDIDEVRIVDKRTGEIVAGWKA
jgi:hypothetical protein